MILQVPGAALRSRRVFSSHVRISSARLSCSGARRLRNVTTCAYRPERTRASSSGHSVANWRDPGMRIETHEEGSQQVAKSLEYLGDYLGLISLVTFLLAGLGNFHARAV